MKSLIAGLALIAFSFNASADHSLKDVMDKKSNVTQAIFNLKIAKLGKDGVCDYENSIQMAVAGGDSNSWRQLVMCYANKEALASARKQLETNPLKEYGKNSLYALNVAATLDVSYKLDENNFGVAELISIEMR